MGTPNIICLSDFYANETTLAKNPILMKKYGERRKFYSCNQEYNYADYVDKGTKHRIDYVEYSGDNEKSSGLFNQNGKIAPKEKFAIKEQLRTTQSVIWDLVLSFKSEFGKRYCNDYDSAYRMMKTEFPRFLKSCGLKPDNIVWFAGLHTNTGKNHIHISFFEKEPMRYTSKDRELHFSQGLLPLICFEQFKLRAEQKLTDITAELKIARKLVTDTNKNVLFSKSSKIKYNTEIQRQMLNLYELFPTDGRLSYDSENMAALRPYIRDIADSVIRSDRNLYHAFETFCTAVRTHDEKTVEMLTNLKIPPEHWDKFLVTDKYMDDLYRRLGNQMINAVRVFKRKERPVKSRLAQKRVKRGITAGLLSYCVKLNAIVETETIEAFEEYMKKLEEKDEEKQLLEEYTSYEME